MRAPEQREVGARRLGRGMVGSMRLALWPVLVLALPLSCSRGSEARETAAEATPSAASLAVSTANAAESEASAVNAAAAAPSNEATAEASDLASGPRGLQHVTSAKLRAEFAGSTAKATLVNAWASWCGPCRREVPMLQALSTNLAPLGVRIVLVSVDAPEDEARAASFLRDQKITLPSFIVEGPLADFKVGMNPRWPGMLPASFLFDARAELVHFWAGEAFESEIVPVIEDFLAGRKTSGETRFNLAQGKLEK